MQLCMPQVCTAIASSAAAHAAGASAAAARLIPCQSPETTSRSLCCHETG
jgi:hypothetical protein